MIRESLSDLWRARDVGEVKNVLTRLSRPYGGIRSWRFTRHSSRDVLCVFVRLNLPMCHSALAQEIGGCVVDGEVSFKVQLGSATAKANSAGQKKPFPLHSPAE
ncbi:MAG: hypothetical protein A2W04_05870 [Betaproteobacteria bacterium RBG_16_64_9]|nr:MAG: hypothetical protein A2W04_05870 [Betaproteobacteria bacterium RBG_16_64_9]OGA24939.1 MAG: hypothetical protein A3I01_12115 [Betaproteobacteria bacterium RIFCSPLOWO2_02_FULL_65_24]OGA33197.1 MAG: hypothetical protein A3G80_12515 [Betaproteobacteria bacterium RIFCSPLOWO2_12_FULL_62_13b]